jgi:plasmid stabilization system protein ParE
VRYRLSRLAARDLANMDDYTAEQFGEHQARRYGALIVTALERLAREPLLPLSRSREELGTDCAASTSPSWLRVAAPGATSSFTDPNPMA